MTTAERPPHPALALPGFTREVKLGTGLTAHIRKVDVEAVRLHTARSVVGSSDLLERAKQDAATSGDQVGLVIEIRRRLLQTALVQPSLGELMALYGGQEDDADLGLGDDMTLLLNAIDNFNPPKKAEDPKKKK